MPFDPELFLKLGGALTTVAEREHREEISRTAVGRLYYAVHLRARENLVATGWVVPQVSQHWAVIDELFARRNPQAGLVKALKRLRTTADYYLDESVTEKDARWASRVAYSLWSKI